ncbi:MAG: hypothetical protein ILP07_13570 [Treponema sp.]|nr:hypothetical protein [Treponema sp.]
MKKKFAVALLFMFFSFALFSEDLNDEHIKKSEILVTSVLDFVDQKDLTDFGIKTFLRKHGELEVYDLGFGLKKNSSFFSSPYMCFLVDYVSYRNTPCKFVVRLDDYYFRMSEKKLDGKVLKRFQEKFSKEETVYLPCYEVDSDGNVSIQERFVYKFVREFPQGIKKYSEHKEKLVGASEKISLPKEFQKYYDFLCSAEEETHYGYLGYVGGEKPTGRIAMENLIKLNDKNVFINILKGDNPCGRIYAAEGLLRLENSQENVDLINKIFAPLVKGRIKYGSIDGCYADFEKYKLYKYDKNLSFPKIEEDFPSITKETKPEFHLDFLYDLQ